VIDTIGTVFSWCVYGVERRAIVLYSAIPFQIRRAYAPETISTAPFRGALSSLFVLSMAPGSNAPHPVHCTSHDSVPAPRKLTFEP
jgi:hypothetical protein